MSKKRLSNTTAESLSVKKQKTLYQTWNNSNRFIYLHPDYTPSNGEDVFKKDSKEETLKYIYCITTSLNQEELSKKQFISDERILIPINKSQIYKKYPQFSCQSGSINRIEVKLDLKNINKYKFFLNIYKKRGKDEENKYLYEYENSFNKEFTDLALDETEFKDKTETHVEYGIVYIIEFNPLEDSTTLPAGGKPPDLPYKKGSTRERNPLAREKEMRRNYISNRQFHLYKIGFSVTEDSFTRRMLDYELHNPRIIRKYKTRFRFNGNYRNWCPLEEKFHQLFKRYNSRNTIPSNKQELFRVPKKYSGHFLDKVDKYAQYLNKNSKKYVSSRDQKEYPLLEFIIPTE